MNSLIDYIEENFETPIAFNSKKIILDKNIIDDLELINLNTNDSDISNNYVDNDTNNHINKDTNNNINKDTNNDINNDINKDANIKNNLDINKRLPLTHYYFNNNNPVSKQVNSLAIKYYTNDIKFLKDNQKLLKYFKYDNNKNENKYNKILETWTSIKFDDNFKEKFFYVDYQILEFLNHSQIFLQFLSLYNLISPIITLCAPIFILIIPLLILKIQKVDINLECYISILKIVAQQNAIGKLLTTNFTSMTLQEQAYSLVTAAFYIFSIYQNFTICYKFYNSMKQVHNNFYNINEYLKITITSMENYLTFSKNLISFSQFNTNLTFKLQQIKEFQNKIENILGKTYCEPKILTPSKLTQIGYILKLFYELHSDENYNKLIGYSLGFNGYIDCICGIQENIKANHINFAKFTKFTKFSNSKNNHKITFKKSYFSNLYYPSLKEQKHVKNDIDLNDNIIITGPNASGKTTILKSTLINIIFTQQFGCGFYENATLIPYKYLHCYLNIPDTSGRDSLFQAEARRCKIILDKIKEDPNSYHFCAFDELYSGTNPEEAEISATAFMNYITKNPIISCILTTHFIKICKKLEKSKVIKNYKMSTSKCSNNNSIIFTYKLKKGISNIKGGIDVLKKMNYPIEIINNCSV